MRYGYHYTSWRNWKKIQKEGLTPYRIEKAELEILGIRPVGIFTWVKKLRGFAHVGSVIYQVAARKTSKIVELRFKYANDDVLHSYGKRVLLYHDGGLSADKKEGRAYHTAVPSVIITQKIPPEKIELVGVYDLNKRMARSI